MAMSLRSIVKSRLWWELVVVMWVLALLGVFSPPPAVELARLQAGLPMETDVTLAVDLTFLVLVMQGVEYLTRQKQTKPKAAAKKKAAA